MKYYLADTLDVTCGDGLIKIKAEGLTAELKKLAEAAARRENLKDVAVIFFHTSCCSPNQMAECMTYWEKLRAQT